MQSGCIEVVAGGMFSGKTEELLRRLKRAALARQSVRLFKPKVDNRYSDTAVVSHSGLEMEATVCDSAWEIFDAVPSGTQVVGIDEAQFFGILLPEVCTILARRGHRVVVAGLDMDSFGSPFGPMPHLMSIAESVTKLRAVCVVCGHEAGFTQRLQGESEDLILVGGHKSYEARCREHFSPRG